MQYLSLLKRARLVILAFVLLAGLATGINLWRTVAGQREGSEEMRRQQHERIRGVVTSEIPLPAHGASLNETQAAVAALSRFLFARSGVSLNESAQRRLAEAETHVLSGAGRRISPSELGNILTATLMERMSALTDEEIAGMMESLRGFNAPDLPDGFRRGRSVVTIHVGGSYSVSPEVFVARAKGLRRLDGVTSNLIRELASDRATGAAQQRAQLFSAAAPQHFARARERGMTPLQAFLVTYSLVSNDPLQYPTSGLPEAMRTWQETIIRATGNPYPHPDGHRAYGPNGYLVSSPLDVMLNEETISALLARLQERSAR